MKKNKLVGRVGVSSKHDGKYLSYSIAVRVIVDDGMPVCLTFTAQADDSNLDRAYALRVQGFHFADYETPKALAFLPKLYKAMEKMQAPRATVHDGKPYLEQCDVSRFLMACEKLGLHVSRFSTWNEAFEFAYNVYEEQRQLSVVSEVAS